MRNKPLKGAEPRPDQIRQDAVMQASKKSDVISGRKQKAPAKNAKFRAKKTNNQPVYSGTQPDEMLGIIVDQRTGQTFYISLIDNFTFKNQEYAVMYNYRMEDGNLDIPEILIMRSYRNKDKQYFTSIRNKKELNTVFDIFYDRFEQSI